MASLITIRQCLLVILLLCSIVVICSTCAEDCDYEPRVGALGKHPGKADPGDKDNEGSDKGDPVAPVDAGHDKDSGSSDEGAKDPKDGPAGEDSGSSEGGKDSEGDAIQNDPAHIVAGALLCFNAKQVYCNCDESYRLSQSGELHVPHDRVEEFCNGPCLSETKLLLNCIEGIMGHFTFFNRATTQDVRDTILAACGDEETKGDLDVTSHVKAKEQKEGEEGGEETSMGHKKKEVIPFVLSIMVVFMVQLCLLMAW